jgi:hypothetical protein
MRKNRKDRNTYEFAFGIYETDAKPSGGGIRGVFGFFGTGTLFRTACEYAENFIGNACGKGAFRACPCAMVRGGVLL